MSVEVPFVAPEREEVARIIWRGEIPSGPDAPFGELCVYKLSRDDRDTIPRMASLHDNSWRRMSPFMAGRLYHAVIHLALALEEAKEEAQCLAEDRNEELEEQEEQWKRQWEEGEYRKWEWDRMHREQQASEWLF